MPGLRLILLLALPVVAIAAARLAIGPEVWSPDVILLWRSDLLEAVASRPVATLAVFAAIYFAIISSALPVGPPMSLMAGFLFGRWLGSAVILLAATAGALVVYRLARLSSAKRSEVRLPRRVEPLLAEIETGLQTNGVGWVLIMRLIPVLPFFLVNVVCGLFAVPVRAFLIGTFVGRIPAVFAVVSLGEQLGRVSSLRELASPALIINLTIVGLLAVVPVAIVGERRRRAAIRARVAPASATGDGDQDAG